MLNILILKSMFLVFSIKCVTLNRNVRSLRDDPDFEQHNELNLEINRSLRENNGSVLGALKAYEEVEDKFEQELAKKMKIFKDSNEKLFVSMNEENNLPLRRLTYTSKYLWDLQNTTVKTFKELKDKCDSYKLAVSEVRHDSDFRTISNYLLGNPHLVVGLGLNDNMEEGKFVEIDGETKIGYQIFGYGEPNNAAGQENCVVISVINGEVLMQDVSCLNINANVICQRRKDSFGFEDSVEHAGMDTDGLTMIGDAENRRYFASHTQKNWAEAKDFCVDNGKQLFNLELNETTNQLIYSQIAWWRGLKGFHWPVGYWTSGKFVNNPLEPVFNWQTSSASFQLTNKLVQWEWVPGEPADQTGKGLELCIDLSLPATPTAAGFVPKLRASNCFLPFYFICYEELQIDASCQENGPMKFIGIHSKYVFDASQSQAITRDEAKDMCERWDYQLAEIESIADLSQVGAFVAGNGFQKREWHLGLNDKDMEGEFYESAGEKTPIVFQAFALSQPDNNNNEDCVVLTADKNGMVMDDRKCSSQLAYTLCQFQKDSSCFLNSAENVRKPVDDIMFFGETATRRYFLSKTQKTWSEAMLACMARKKKLLDLLFIGELNNFKNQVFYPKLIAWARKYRTGIWTSGRYLRSIEDGEFRWETTLEMFKNDEKSINFTWAPGEPSDSTKRRLEICIELVIEHWANSKPGDPLIPMLKAANCKLPNYFVCYEEAPHLKKCHLPPKIEYGFKALSETSRFLYVDTPKKKDAKDREKTCRDWGLEVAEISSLRDYKTVSETLEAWNVTSAFSFGLGLNSVGSEGLWFEGDGKNPIRFQAFGSPHPLYYENNEPLDHVVFDKFQSPVWKMTAISDRRKTNILCQFKRDSTCHFQTIFTYMDENVPKDYLIKLNYNDGELIGNFSYYVADSQNTWSEAMRFCWSRNMKLLDLKVDVKQAQAVYSLLVDWLRKKGLTSTIARFWTSGKYVGSFADNQFRWETTWSFARHEELQKELELITMPPPVTTANNDRCIALELDNMLPENGKYKAQLKVSNCHIPYFIICAENKPSKPFENIVPSTPAPEVKIKQVHPCKPLVDSKNNSLQDVVLKWIKSQRPIGYLNCE